MAVLWSLEVGVGVGVSGMAKDIETRVAWLPVFKCSFSLLSAKRRPFSQSFSRSHFSFLPPLYSIPHISKLCLRLFK
jgi:hypothetical protein